MHYLSTISHFLIEDYGILGGIERFVLLQELLKDFTKMQNKL